MANLDGYTLQYSSPPGPPTIGISYSTGIVAPSPRTSSSRLLKRKRSESTMTVTAVTVAVSTDGHPGPIILPDINHNPNEPYVAPPSPVPTEIIEDMVEESCEERMEAAKALGVKVRDFAYEPVPRSAGNAQDLRAPEIWWTPLERLIEHDRYIRIHPPHAGPNRLPGKALHNLLAIGWVTPEEAQAHWQPEDWEAVNEYKNRFNNPYPVRIFASKKKPTWAYRAALREKTFKTLDDDVPEECIVRVDDEPWMDDGPKRVPDAELRLARPNSLHSSLSHPSSPATAAAGPTRAQPLADDVHAGKRRRVSSMGSGAGTPTPPASPAAVPSRTLSRSASFELARADTPPVEEVKTPRQSRRIQRTQTLASIPVR